MSRQKSDKTVKKEKLKKSVAKAINIESAESANGAIDNGPKIFDFLNSKDFPYTVKTVKEYHGQLEKMSLSDLQRHAIEVASLIPNITDRHKLIDKLEKEFLRRQSLFYSRSTSGRSTVSAEAEANIKSILNRKSF